MHLVVARYNENISWLAQIPVVAAADGLDVDLYVYNKGPPLKFADFRYPPYVKNAYILTLPNVGRCDHTYMHHIATFYDHLPDVCVFLPGSANGMHKWTKTYRTIRRAYDTCDSVFVSEHVGSVRKGFGKFSINQYVATASENTIGTPPALVPSRVRPFGRWFDAHFAGQDSRFVCYTGIFAVHRRDVRRRPRGLYARLTQELSAGDNLEVGHYVERAWTVLFHVDAEHALV